MKGLGELQGILLDLDDTLYSERNYFQSGLAAVATWLSEHDGRTNCLVEIIADVELHGRQGVLDRISLPTSMPWINSDTWRKTLLHVYRNHNPSLTLFDDVKVFLNQCRNNDRKLGLITDGVSCVQWRKVKSLGLDKMIDVVVVTEDIGAPKPSPISFSVAAGRLGVRTENCVYIGDDASKDFIGPRELGMVTIRLQRHLPWPLASSALIAEAEAHYHVNSLHDVGRLLFESSI